MEWKIGKVRKTAIGASLRSKFKKMFSSIGMHREIDRLSKIKDKKKLEEEIIEIANKEYPSDETKKLQFADSLYKKIGEISFKKDNRKVLKEMYKAFEKVKSDKVEKNDLSHDLANFYDEISKSKNYDEFVSNVYSYVCGGKNITNVADELIKLSVPKFELTYRGKDPIRLPKNIADIYGMVMLIRQELSQVAKKVEQDYSKLTQEVEEFKSDNSIDNSKKTEIIFAFGNKSPDKTVNFRIGQVDEVIAGLKKFKKQLANRIRLSTQVNADIQDNNEGEVLGRLHMLLSSKSESSPERVLENAISDYSKIRGMMQKARAKKITSQKDERGLIKKGVNDANAQGNGNRGKINPELIRMFEGNAIKFK